MYIKKIVKPKKTEIPLIKKELLDSLNYFTKKDTDKKSNKNYK